MYMGNKIKLDSFHKQATKKTCKKYLKNLNVSQSYKN